MPVALARHFAHFAPLRARGAQVVAGRCEITEVPVVELAVCLESGRVAFEPAEVLAVELLDLAEASRVGWFQGSSGAARRNPARRHMGVDGRQRSAPILALEHVLAIARPETQNDVLGLGES